MEYIFGNARLNKKVVRILKTVNTQHTNLSGANQIQRKYPDCTITDDFVVINKYLSKTDSEGRCYDWYVIADHYRYIDYFTPRSYELEEDSEGLLDIADLVDENSTAITDLADYITELEARIEELEG